MKFREWLKDLNYEVLQGDLDTEAEDVVYDSRKAVPGTNFVCLKGTRIDSHGFIEMCIRDSRISEHPGDSCL